MFGKPEWFTYRLAGWGIAPKTWQGWVYVGTFLICLFALVILPIPQGLKNVLMVTLMGLFFVDALVIWAQMGKHQDERQRLHQLIIERNCSLVAVLALVAAGFYQAYQNRNLAATVFPFDPFLLVVLGAMAITKLISTLYLRWRM